MPTFTYEAKDNAGKSISGIIEANAERDAAASLRDQGLWPTRIEATRGGRVVTPTAPGLPSSQSMAMGTSLPGALSAESALGANAVTFTPPNVTSQTRLEPLGKQSRIDIAPFLMAVPLDVLAMFYRQLATLIEAGVPMTQALSTLTQQIRQPQLKKILSEATQFVSGGYPLSSVMEKHPNTFSTIQIELIRAGEAGGMLDVMCSRLADYLERELEVRRKLKRETLYPKIVLFVAFLVALVLGFVKAGMGQSGLAVVGSKIQFALIIGAIAFALWWGGRYLNQIPFFGVLWDYIKLYTPGAGGVARGYATARFARAMSALYAGGVNIFRAVEIAARACGNRAVGTRILQEAPALQAGAGISGMLQSSGLLNPLAIQMARTGEQTGSMDLMMNKVADYLESEADTKSHQLAVSMGVLALLIAACVVGFIAISFYAGYFGEILKDQGG